MRWSRGGSGRGKARRLRRRARAEALRLEELEDRCVLSFVGPFNYDTGGQQPFSVAAGDFTGDGLPDLVVANAYSENAVSVLLNNGDGTFQPAHTYDPGLLLATSVAVGDFNGDGVADLAVAGIGANGDGAVSVLLGNGDGSFQPAQSYDVGNEFNLSEVAIGDFNHDGILDLAVAKASYNFPFTVYGNVNVLLGNGDGTFQGAQEYDLEILPGSLAVGDLTGDGSPDLIVAGADPITRTSSVDVLRNRGNGTFTLARTYALGAYPSSVAVGDFTGDGLPDLAVAVAGSNSVSVLLNHGDGTFQPAQTYAVGDTPVALAVGDFTGDGFLDLAVANNRSNNVSVLRNKRDGTFQPAGSFNAGLNPSAVAVADFNGDGWPDLAVANGGSSKVSILLNNGHWPPHRRHPAAPGSGGGSIGLDDVNGPSDPGSFPDQQPPAQAVRPTASADQRVDGADEGFRLTPQAARPFTDPPAAPVPQTAGRNSSQQPDAGRTALVAAQTAADPPAPAVLSTPDEGVDRIRIDRADNDLGAAGLAFDSNDTFEDGFTRQPR